MMMMMMMMMMMTMMNCFCGMVEQRKAFSLNSSRNHCQRSSPLRISDTPRAGFEPAQNLSSGLVEWSCELVITTIPQQSFRYEVCYVFRCSIETGFIPITFEFSIDFGCWGTIFDCFTYFVYFFLKNDW